MKKVSKAAVIGGGNGAFAETVELTLNGFEVSLCDPYKEGESLRPLMTDNKMNYVGVFGNGSIKLNCITSNVAQAVDGADLVIVSVPSTAHEAMAAVLAPVLQSGVPVLLHPGHSGGALHFRHALKSAGYTGDLVLGEANTLKYIARKQDPKTINISNVSKNLIVAPLPAIYRDRLMERVLQCFPDIKPARTVLATTLRNPNSMMHPPGMILGAAWIEHSHGDFNFYYDAATPAVEKLMQAIDEERQAIGVAWNEPVEPLMDLLLSLDVTTPEAAASGSLQRAFLESAGNRWIKAPSSLDHRYMHEDMAFGLVPTAALGEVVGVQAQVIRSLILIAGITTGRNYWAEGLNLERMGLAGKSPEEVRALVEQG